MKKLLYLSFLFLTVLAFGQEKTVFGKVVSLENGEPLPGATVIIKNTTKGTNTDFDGNYSITANLNDTLVFKYIVYKTQEIIADKEEINVIMEEGENPKIELGPPYRPQRPISIPIRITAKDIKNADNPKYMFRKNAKSNMFIVFVSELTSYDFSKEELEFQGKYNIKYSLIGNYSVEYLEKNNKLTFKHLNKKYNTDWQNEIRKDAIGLDEFLK